MAKFFESKNPLIKESALNRTIGRAETGGVDYIERMTIAGAVNKTFVLFALLMVTTTFKPKTAPYAAPIYAILEGLFVGTISSMYAVGGMEGIIGQAVMLTFGTLIMMLLIHRSGLVPVTEKFRMGVFMATGAIMLSYVASWIMSMFGMNMPYLHDGGMIGIGISVVIIGVAALNLLLDFDNFEKGEEAGAPKYMEWLFAMGLLVTLVWLYIEFLRLLSKLNRD